METLIYGIPAVGLVIGLTELIKKLGLNPKYAPLIALAWGIIISFTANSIFGAIGITGIILRGLVLGLTASGLWSGTKATVLGK